MLYTTIRLEIPAHCNHPPYFDEYLMDVGLFCADSCEVDMSYKMEKECKRATVRMDLSSSQIKKLDKLVYSFQMKRTAILRCILNDMHWKPSKYQSIPEELQQPLDYDLIKKHKKNLPNYHHLGQEIREREKQSE